MANPYLIGASVAAPIIGGLYGEYQARGDRRMSEEQIKEAIRQLEGLKTLDPESQKVALEQLRQEGILTPELEEAFTLEGTSYDNIKTDPAYKEAQRAALRKFQQVGNEGLTVEDRAALEAVQSEVAAQERGQREAILQNARSRGMAGSGMELAAQLQAQQSAAGRNRQAGLDIAADARRRALAAMAESGRLASDLRGQDFSEQERIAAAKDRIAEFNANTRQGVQGRNVDRRNDATGKNLSEKQRISDANTGIRNDQNVHNNVTVYDKAYDRDAEKRKALAGAYGQASDYYGGRADRTVQKYAGMGQGVSSGVNAYNKYKYGKDED